MITPNCFLFHAHHGKILSIESTKKERGEKKIKELILANLNRILRGGNLFSPSVNGENFVFLVCLIGFSELLLIKQNSLLAVSEVFTRVDRMKF